jgi:hypothetical protein
MRIATIATTGLILVSVCETALAGELCAQDDTTGRFSAIRAKYTGSTGIRPKSTAPPHVTWQCFFHNTAQNFTVETQLVMKKDGKTLAPYAFYSMGTNLAYQPGWTVVTVDFIANHNVGIPPGKLQVNFNVEFTAAK